MIPITPGNIVLAFVAGPLIGLLLLWIVANIARRGRERRRRHLCIQCMFCGTVFHPGSQDALSACPHCARPNERTPPPSV